MNSSLIEINKKNDIGNNSVIDLVDRIIDIAIMKHASDIHIEPNAAICKIRLRCNGLLLELMNLPKSLGMQMIIRLKVMAELNIAEQRLPQDGKIIHAHNKAIYIRVSTCPTIHGEKIALRLLNAGSTLSINELGLLPEQEEFLKQQLQQPSGLVLIAGPTGSGKTNTLYALLNHLNHITKNIVTIEDPVEIQLDGINQVNIQPAIGFDFADALHAFLRQDPDVIMIGEIRDRKTAQLALQATQTGHLILATMHAHNSLQGLSRLATLAQHNLAQLMEYNINVIIAQRLIRVCCQTCRGQTKINCANTSCFAGFTGRTGIFEFSQIKKSYLFNLSLADVALQKVKNGITTIDEIQRVLGTPTHT